MIEHNLKVKDDIIEPVSLVIPSGNVETHVLILDFNDTWTDLKKMAVFTRDGTAKEYTIDGNTRTIPGDILSDSGEFTVGVYGYIMDGETLVKRLSTNILTGKIIKGAYSNAEQGESDVPPSAYEKLESTVENHIDNHENPHEVTADQVGSYGKQAIDDAFSGMNRKIAAKLDKVKSDFILYPGIYATTDTDGTPYLMTATNDLGYIGKGSGYIATYDGGELKTGTPTSDDSAANKGYVDDQIAEAVAPVEEAVDGLSAALTGKENSGNKGQPNGYAPLDANGKLPDSYLYGVTVKQYGVRWKGTSSTVCERLGDAVGLTAKAHKGSTESVDNDFDNIYPWSDIKTCNIDADGNVLAYLGEPSFARDGTNGDVMVEIPKFYYKRVKTGIVEEIWICGTKLPGYELHPLFIDNGKEVSKVFHSVYNASSFTDETDNKVKLQSITGVQPRVRTTRANFRTYARNKGAIWGIEDISCVNALQLLYLVEYANTHSQSALGSGADNLSYTANHKALEETTNGNTITIASTYKNTYKLGQRIEIGTSQGVNNKTTTPRTITAITTDEETGQTTITFDGNPITIAVGNMMWNVAPLNGSCDALNGKSGWLAGENNYTDHFADVNYRGIEGFHAKLFRLIDGVNIKDRVVYYANSIADYADGVYDGKYRAVGYSNAKANGYVSAFGYDEKAPWVMFPSAAVGGSSTFVPDYYYQNTGERLLLLGGLWYSGADVGAFCFYCYGAFSYSYLNCGSHLLVKKP